jgi:hypothetical protein
MRAEKPKDEDELNQLIKSAVKDKLEMGELDETQLTLKDLDEIIYSFTSSLRGVYHPRIQYPKNEIDVVTRPVSYRIPDVDTPPVTPNLDPTKRADR